jgi:hypothetical protein
LGWNPLGIGVYYTRNVVGEAQMTILQQWLIFGGIGIGMFIIGVIAKRFERGSKKSS